MHFLSGFLKFQRYKDSSQKQHIFGKSQRDYRLRFLDRCVGSLWSIFYGFEKSNFLGIYFKQNLFSFSPLWLKKIVFGSLKKWFYWSWKIIIRIRKKPLDRSTSTKLDNHHVQCRLSYYCEENTKRISITHILVEEMTNNIVIH